MHSPLFAVQIFRVRGALAHTTAPPANCGTAYLCTYSLPRIRAVFFHNFCIFL